MNSKKQIIVVLVGLSIIIVLGLGAFFFLGFGPSQSENYSQENNDEKIVVEHEAVERPSGFQIFREDKAIEVTNSPIPTTPRTSFYFPEEWQLEVVEENTVDGLNNEFYKLSSSDNILVVTIDHTFKIDPDFRVPRTRPEPSLLNFSPRDFEVVANIDNQNLFISRTGATNLFVGDRNQPQLVADSIISVDQDYNVYQTYGDQLSEYLNIYQRAEDRYPSFDYNTIISYKFRKEISQEEWRLLYKPQLEQIVQSIRV